MFVVFITLVDISYEMLQLPSEVEGPQPRPQPPPPSDCFITVPSTFKYHVILSRDLTANISLDEDHPFKSLGSRVITK